MTGARKLALALGCLGITLLLWRWRLEPRPAIGSPPESPPEEPKDRASPPQDPSPPPPDVAPRASGTREEVDIPELSGGEERTQRVELPTKNDLRFLGRLLEDPTGAPISGAEVLLFEGNSWGTSWPIYQPSGVLAELAYATTDQAGRFELWTPSWKRTLVRVRAPGYSEGYTSVEPGHSERGTEVLLRVRASADLVARVEQSGSPMEGIRVSLSLDGGWIRSGETDPAGSCAFVDLPAGVPLEAQLVWPEPESGPAPEGEEPWSWFMPTVHHQRLYQRVPAQVTLAPGETRTETWQLASRCTLRGVAREASGQAAPGVTLRLLRCENVTSLVGEPFIMPVEKFPDLIRTDEDGGFEIPTLPGASTWWLVPAPLEEEHGDIAPVATRVTIPEGATELWVDLAVRRVR